MVNYDSLIQPLQAQLKSDGPRKGPRFLGEMCLDVALKNAALITDLGSLPTSYVEPILKVVKTATQLHQLEVNSTDIWEVTPKHWQRLIKKDFPVLSSRHRFEPQNPKSWHKVYDKYKKLEEENIAAATAKLIEGFAAKTEQKQSRSAKLLSAHEGGKLQPHHRAKAGWSLPREKSTFMSKTKAQLRVEASRFRLRTPTGKLPVPAGQIKKAPMAMVEQARIRQQPDLVIRPPISKATPTSDKSAQEREERESRLLRIKNANRAKQQTATNILSFSDDEDEDPVAAKSPSGLGDKDDVDDSNSVEDDDDDLFGDREFSKFTRTAASSSAEKVPALLPSPAIRPSAKRPRAVEDSDEAKAAKRRRSVEETTAPSSAASNTALRKAPPPTKLAVRPRPRGIGLSAAPGANKGRPPPPRRPAQEPGNINNLTKSNPATPRHSVQVSGSGNQAPSLSRPRIPSMSPAGDTVPVRGKPVTTAGSPPAHPLESGRQNALRVAEVSRRTQLDPLFRPGYTYHMVDGKPVYIKAIPFNHIMRPPVKLRPH